MPVKTYTHDQILEELGQYATRGWIKRFIAVKNQGFFQWLMVIRDFNIQHQTVEYLVDDIVRALEPLPQGNSIVRAEMESLEAQGKLDLSTPELAEEWDKKLKEEQQQSEEWRRTDEVARDKQRKADLEFIAKKQSSESMVIPMKAQDPRTDNFQVRPIESEPVPTVIKPDTQVPKVPGILSEEKAEPPVAPVTAPVEHAKELSEEEKVQQAFVPKPPPEVEPEYKEPTIKSISTTDSGGNTTVIEVKKESPSVSTIEGLGEDSVKRLKDSGVNTVAQLEKMSRDQAKEVLGMPVYQSIQTRLKT